MEKYGIIYADFAHSVENGSWGGESYSYTAGTGFKNYYVDGKYEEGPFPANDILVADGEGNERFLIMALEDISASTYTWYASKSSAGISVTTETGIGLNEEEKEIGKANTETMLGVWTADTDTAKSSDDIWGQIEANSNWFVPSRDELLAFADAFDIDSGNFSETYGLSVEYWTSSQDGIGGAWCVYFDEISMDSANISSRNDFSVRLSATF